jgi:serine/threonine-protein kinase
MLTEREPCERAELVPGRVVGGKYRVLRQIGAGGMGTVYEAEHVALGRVYALKFLRQDVDAKPRGARRFEREARLLARLVHENIVSLLDIGQLEDGRPYLVLEHINGRTLRAELEASGIRSVERVLEIAEQMGRGLAHAHASGVVHRDLKPENVMLAAHADGRLLVKLLDFGVAKLREDREDPVTGTGAVLGTAAYMSPEQARGETTLDAASDVYSFGVILYEALAGKRPYDGRSYNETLYAILNKAHEPLERLRPDLPEPIAIAVERALAKTPGARFGTVDALVGALRAGAPHAKHLRNGAASSLVTGADESVELAQPREQRLRSPRLRLGVFGVAVGALALGLLAAARSPSTTVPAARAATESGAPASVPKSRSTARLDAAAPRAPEPQPTPAVTRVSNSEALARSTPREAGTRAKTRRLEPGSKGRAARPNASEPPAAPSPEVAVVNGIDLFGDYIADNPYVRGERAVP